MQTNTRPQPEQHLQSEIQKGNKMSKLIFLITCVKELMVGMSRFGNNYLVMSQLKQENEEILSLKETWKNGFASPMERQVSHCIDLCFQFFTFPLIRLTANWQVHLCKAEDKCISFKLFVGVCSFTCIYSACQTRCMQMAEQSPRAQQVFQLWERYSHGLHSQRTAS